MSWSLTGNAATSDDFLGTTDSEPLVIKTNNSEAMRVDPTGKVGVGTTTPHVPLEVAGSVFSNLGLGNNFILNAHGANYGFIANEGVGTWSLGYGTDVATVATPVLTWNAEGLVGIGTTGPQSELDVQATGTLTAVSGTSAQNTGVYGESRLSGQEGSVETPGSPGGVGVKGVNQQAVGRGVVGLANGGTSGIGVFGDTTGSPDPAGLGDIGVYGRGLLGGVAGEADSTRPSTGVSGSGQIGVSGSGPAVGVQGFSLGGTGVMGQGDNSGVAAFNSHNSNAAYLASDCCAAYLVGPVAVIGNLSKSSGGFFIDHPGDPANKFLSHSFVESPDMKNVYDGVILLDANGEAVVDLPEWFETLNTDFRYQVTCIGGHAPVYISREIQGNRFKIAGGSPSMKVSWQVTGVRQDAWANAHRILVEQEKRSGERGYYLNPELYGATSEQSIERVRHRMPPQQPKSATKPAVSRP